jgi:plastocyanin
MHRSLRLSLAAALLAAPLLTACGDDDDSSSSSTTSAAAAGGSALEVGGTDQLTFDKSSYEAEAGTIDITYVNEGSVVHTLLIEGVDDFKLSIGDTDEGTVELEPGTYLLYCDVAGHQAAGMEADLTVS